MKRDNWPVDKEGIRPAIDPTVDPNKCLYCGEIRGGVHKPECVVRQRTVVVRVSIDYVITVPESWTPEQIEFHRNLGSWCAANGLHEIDSLFERADDCFCSRTEYTYLREATVEDELKDQMFVAELPS